MRQVDNRWTQWMANRADANTREMLEEFQIALQAGQIPINGVAAPQAASNFAGGTNYCPNSDLRYSTRAATIPGTLPTDNFDNNFEAYRFYRQEKETNIVVAASNALKSAGHSLFAANEAANSSIPVWNRTFGHIELGAEDFADAMDIAVQLYQNPVRASQRWYVRLELAAADATPVPGDLEVYCGFWHKKNGGSENWIEGAPFTLSCEPIGPRGTASDQYKVIAETDSGVQMESQILTVNNSPNVLSGNALNRIVFNGASGFTKFSVYKLRSNVYYYLGEARNTNNLSFDDTGGAREIVGGFPSVEQTNLRAFAQSFDANIGVPGTRVINDFTIQVPNYDETQTLAGGQFLRFGLTRAAAINRQIIIDKIWLGLTFNDWSDSPDDAFKATAVVSTSATSGAETIGVGNGAPPEPNTGGCIAVDTPVLRLDFDFEHEWMAFKDIPCGDILESGDLEPNLCLSKQFKDVFEYWYLETECGVWQETSIEHRYILPDKSPIRANTIKKGDRLRGWRAGRVVAMIVKTSRLRKGYRRVGTPQLTGNKHYISGHSSDDASGGLENHNRKYDPFFTVWEN